MFFYFSDIPDGKLRNPFRETLSHPRCHMSACCKKKLRNKRSPVFLPKRFRNFPEHGSKRNSTHLPAQFQRNSVIVWNVVLFTTVPICFGHPFGQFHVVDQSDCVGFLSGIRQASSRWLCGALWTRLPSIIFSGHLLQTGALPLSSTGPPSTFRACCTAGHPGLRIPRADGALYSRSSSSTLCGLLPGVLHGCPYSASFPSSSSSPGCHLGTGGRNRGPHHKSII
jgi:hypothetical protein